MFPVISPHMATAWCMSLQVDTPPPYISASPHVNFSENQHIYLAPCVGPSWLLYLLQSLRRVRPVCYGRQLARVKWHDGLQICVALNIVRNPPFQSLSSLKLQGCRTAVTYCVTEWNVCAEDTGFSQCDANRTWRNYSELEMQAEIRPLLGHVEALNQYISSSFAT